MPNDDIDLRINVDFPSKVVCGIHLRAISQEVLMYLDVTLYVQNFTEGT